MHYTQPLLERCVGWSECSVAVGQVTHTHTHTHHTPHTTHHTHTHHTPHTHTHTHKHTHAHKHAHTHTHTYTHHTHTHTRVEKGIPLAKQPYCTAVSVQKMWFKEITYKSFSMYCLIVLCGITHTDTASNLIGQLNNSPVTPT